MDANETREAVLSFLKEVYGMLENANDPKLSVCKSHVRNAIGAINPKETVGLRGLNSNVGGIPKTSFGTTPPKRKGNGSRNQAGAHVAEGKEAAEIVVNENTTFRTGIPGNKKKGTPFVEQKPEITIDDINKEELEIGDEGNDADETKKIEFSIAQISKIEAHPEGGLMKKLIETEKDTLLEMYSVEQLKAIAEKIGADVHPATKRADTILTRILERINFITTDLK